MYKPPTRFVSRSSQGQIIREVTLDVSLDYSNLLKIIVFHIKSCYQSSRKISQNIHTKTVLKNTFNSWILLVIICILSNMPTADTQLIAANHKVGMPAHNMQKVQKNISYNNQLLLRRINEQFCRHCRAVVRHYSLAERTSTFLSEILKSFIITSFSKNVCERNYISNCHKLFKVLRNHETTATTLLSKIIARTNNNNNNIYKSSLLKDNLESKNQDSFNIAKTRSKRGAKLSKQIYCRANGRLLKMNPDGKVQGTLHASDPLSRFIIYCEIHNQ